MNGSEHTINLVCLSQEPARPAWALGSTFVCPPTSTALHHTLESQLEESPAEAWLFWDEGLGDPPTPKIQSYLDGGADVWHAGLQLGLAGKPGWINFINPTWMLNRDPNPTIEATSWRLSLRACLVRTEILRQLGGPDPRFETLAGAGLELGHRYIRGGAFLRHMPDLLEGSPPQPEIKIPLTDQLRFIQSGFSTRWLVWAGLRAILTGAVNPLQLWRAWRSVKGENPYLNRKPYQRQSPVRAKADDAERVSVLIPTLNRYPYLHTLLEQLQTQTIPPYEILIVDQTPQASRQDQLAEDYPDLPICYFTLDQAGQCSSRNMGIIHARGDSILLLDDDVEVPPNLLESHLNNLSTYNNNVSSGIVYEKDLCELPQDFKFIRISNVFPGGNSFISKDILCDTGLFDLAFDHGQRADHDLGMRIYLQGELMILDPSIAILHHHAPQGGLREHKARVDTYAASRHGLFKQNLPTPSEIYLAKRYFSREQVRERMWISILGTFSIEGTLWKRVLKIIISLLRLPCNLWTLHKRSKDAQNLLKDYPQIPHLRSSEQS